MELKRVVVTGMGAVTPLGNDPKTTWEAMVAGKSGAAPITLFDASKFKTQFACEVKGLDVNAYIDRKEARKMDRYTQLAIVAAKQAVEDSAMDQETEDKDRIGVRKRKYTFFSLTCSASEKENSFSLCSV